MNIFFLGIYQKAIDVPGKLRGQGKFKSDVSIFKKKQIITLFTVVFLECSRQKGRVVII